MPLHKLKHLVVRLACEEVLVAAKGQPALTMSCGYYATIVKGFHFELYAPCTLKVRPLAVFRSFSSLSGLARRRTARDQLKAQCAGGQGLTYLEGSLLYVVAFSSGCMPLRL